MFKYIDKFDKRARSYPFLNMWPHSPVCMSETTCNLFFFSRHFQYLKFFYSFGIDFSYIHKCKLLALLQYSYIFQNRDGNFLNHASSCLHSIWKALKLSLNCISDYPPPLFFQIFQLPIKWWNVNLPCILYKMGKSIILLLNNINFYSAQSKIVLFWILALFVYAIYCKTCSLNSY